MCTCAMEAAAMGRIVCGDHLAWLRSIAHRLAATTSAMTPTISTAFTRGM